MVVPRLIRFAGVVKDSNGNPLSGVAGITFALYKDQEGGAALWLETQNVSLDAAGHYSVLLGSTKEEGIPMDLFTSGQAQWLGVRVEGQRERARVLLVSVPYALKAQEAETLAGKSAAQFVSADSLKQQVRTEVRTQMRQATSAGPSTTSASPRSASPQNTAATAAGATNFSANTTNQVVGVTQLGTGVAVNATAPSNHAIVGSTGFVNGIGVYGKNTNTGTSTSTLFGYGVRGDASTVNGRGVRGVALGASGVGVQATALGISGIGLEGENTATSGGTVGIAGTVASPTGTAGVFTSAGGKILSLRSQSGEKASVDGTGNFTTSGMVKGSAANFKGGNSTTLSVSQTGTGDGMDIFSSGEGIVVQTTGSPGIVTNGGIVDSGFVSVQGPATGAMSVTTPGTSGTATTALTVSDTDSNSSDTNVGVNASTTSSSGIGVKATAGPPSSLIASQALASHGVWGDTGVVFGSGVLGTADEGNGVRAVNNAVSDVPALYAANFTTMSTAPVFEAVGAGQHGSPRCTIDVNANLACNGTKSAVVPINNGQKFVALYAEESAENWFADYGSGQLVNGVTTITLEPTYAQTVNTNLEYHVFLTAKGDCKGLYVTNETPVSFEVHELQSGRSNIAFDYRIIAMRKGTEQLRLADKTAMMKTVQGNGLRLPSKLTPSAKSANSKR